MYNTSTRSFTMEDASGSYSWMVEGFDPADFQTMSDAEIYAWIDQQTSLMKDADLLEIEQQAESNVYPRYGYTTAQVFENEDEWLQFKREELAEDLKNERTYVFDFLKQWIAGD